MGRPLPWTDAALLPTALMATLSVAYLVYHYGLDAKRLAGWLARRGRTPARAARAGVLLRRLLGGVLFVGASLVVGLGPLGLEPQELGLSAPAWGASGLWVGGLYVLLVGILFLSSRGAAHQARYPELRAERWTLGLWARSAGSWALYLLGYELLFRGFLLFPLAARWDAWTAIAVMTALYVFAHLPKDAGETAGCLLMGTLFGAMALNTGAMWAPFALHLLIAVSSDTFAILHNPAMRWGASGETPPAP